MKHRMAFRKFSRTTSHRNLMLRNLVTSLFEYEQIKTTLPKAKDTARLAEKMITQGKKNNTSAYECARRFLLKPIALERLFDMYGPRYKKRPGGYTRVLKLGRRKGDNAPMAVLELVDNPRDLRWDMTARAIGREVVAERLQSNSAQKIVNSAFSGLKPTETLRQLLKTEQEIQPDQSGGGRLRPITRWNLQKVLKFRTKNAAVEMEKKVQSHIDHLMATPVVAQELYETRSDVEDAAHRRTPRPRPRPAGYALPGETKSVRDLIKGGLGHSRRPRRKMLLDEETVFKQDSSRA
ncbi:mitochondrial ribosomal protein L17 [Fistulina hepatica ATCC 64428]|uniref:Mitochondrial ribosomal protein L17 n=1 Tax=Fistulina hepatica ATCC 64428 TaxID=1128425 RepID=A0A0D7A9G0_9AGAR|nr:mitochondrial ribosomal protein L17 [Fistulina hepatica ATCC 64428]